VKLNYLSNESGDNLLQFLHDFCERHRTKSGVFIHSKYRSIHDCIGKAINQLYQIYDINILYPKCLLDSTNQQRNVIQLILHNRGGGSLNSILPSTSSNPSSSRTFTNNASISYAKGIGLNIIEIVSQYLTEINIEDFDPRHIEHLHLEERCYSTFASGDLVFHIYHEIQEVYGVDVIPVCLQISFDGTDISNAL
jgi:hypothetical protein